MPSSTDTLRRDLRELGPLLRLTLAGERGAGAERVYRVEKKDMLEFFTVRYAPDSSIDDVELFSEY